eukprot:149187-Prymnesium_polylepis.1
MNKTFTPHPVSIMRARSGESVAAPGPVEELHEWARDVPGGWDTTNVEDIVPVSRGPRVAAGRSVWVRAGRPGSARVSAGVRRRLTVRTSVPSHPRTKAYGLGVSVTV